MKPMFLNRRWPMPMVALAVAVAWCSAAPPAAAQAWLPAAGETTLSTSYQATEYEGHLDDRGVKIAFLPSHSRVLLLEVDHGLTNRLALRARMPYVWAKRYGPDGSPVKGTTGLDDGHWHGNLQDYVFSLRYAALVSPVALAPFVRYSIPSHSYETEYEAAPGRDLEELAVGADVGRLLGPWIEDAFFEAGLSYVFVERAIGISTDRLQGSFSLGYFVTPTLTARINGGFQNVYGGMSFDYFDYLFFNENRSPREELEFLEHDRLIEDDHERLGLALSWSFWPGWETSAFWSTIVDGSAAHYGDSYGITLTRSFLGRRKKSR